jgi:hypothetical protein
MEIYLRRLIKLPSKIGSSAPGWARRAEFSVSIEPTALSAQRDIAAGAPLRSGWI